MTKPKAKTTKRAPRKPKAPDFGDLGALSASQAKAAVKKSVEDFVTATRQGHRMPVASTSSGEDRVLVQTETLDDRAHDLLMEFGRLLVEQGYTSRNLLKHPIFNPPTKGKRNA